MRLRFLVVFPSPCRRMPGQNLKLGHGCFLSTLSISLFIKHPIIRRYPQHAAGPSPEPGQFSPHSHNLFCLLFDSNVIFPSAHASPTYFHEVFGLKLCIQFSSSASGYMPGPSQPPCICHPIYIISWRVGTLHCVIFLRPSIISTLIGPNILLSTTFSHTLNVCSSLRVSDQVLHVSLRPCHGSGG
jgi:hypothetical protein